MCSLLAPVYTSALERGEMTVNKNLLLQGGGIVVIVVIIF
jgi:hypothetical protein